MIKEYKCTSRNFQKMYGKKGITLMSLIITVIILLILSGIAISISVKGGNLFEKTENTVEQWNEKVGEEENNMQNALDTLDMAANPDLAKYRLTVKVNYDENEDETSVESPYFVNYPSAKGTIKCRVLYNDRTYGLQIISAASVTKVTLGKDDPNENVQGQMGSVERAQNSYNRAVMTLNEKAEEYLDENGIATDARCVGSNPLNKNFPDNLTGEERKAEMFVADSEYTYMNNYNGKFFKEDSNNFTDSVRMKKIGTLSFLDSSYGSWYWMASRRVYLSTTENYAGYCFCPYLQNRSNNQNARWGFLRVDTNGVIESSGSAYGFRPVFILADGVKVIGGEGTEEVPYELGL